MLPRQTLYDNFDEATKQRAKAIKFPKYKNVSVAAVVVCPVVLAVAANRWGDEPIPRGVHPCSFPASAW